MNYTLVRLHADNCRLMTGELREYRGSGIWVSWPHRLDYKPALRWIWP